LDKSVSATPDGLASTVGNGEESKAGELNELKQQADKETRRSEEAG
jgi:hypothetical protein